MRTRRASKDPDAEAVDWTALPAEVLQVGLLVASLLLRPACTLHGRCQEAEMFGIPALCVGDLLSRQDLVRVSESCKSWRGALWTLLLKDVLVCPAELCDGTSIRSTGTAEWLHLQSFLRHARVSGTLTLVITDRQWPSEAQLDAVIAALAQQPCAWRLRLRVIEQRYGSSISRTMWSALISSLGRVCSRLAADAPQVTSLEFTCHAAVVDTDASRLVQALAQLSSIEHLVCNIDGRREDGVGVKHLTALTALTALTSLEVTGIRDYRDTQQAPEAAVPQVMQLLAQLTRLHSIKLAIPFPISMRGGTLRVQLPALPNLRHLHLPAYPHCPVLLLLSAQHCAQLESLTCPQFQPAAGVSSMEQLTQLEVQRMPPQAQQQRQQQQQQQQQARGAPLLPLHFPKLQRAKIEYEDDSLAFLADLASRAPAIKELDMHDTYTCSTESDERMLQLLAQLPPLRSLATPDSHDVEVEHPGVGAYNALPRWLPQQTRLQSLSFIGYIAHDQLPLLRACSSLRDLELFEDSTSALHNLPPQLTALTFWTSRNSPSSGRVAKVLMPPLQSLLVTGCAAVLQEVLPLSELTQLTSLRADLRGALCMPADGLAMPADISKLTQLVELHAPAWPSMALDLACLKGLKRLWLWPGADGTEVQVGQVSRLTQLRELHVWSREGPVQELLAQQLSSALPHCIMEFG